MVETYFEKELSDIVFDNDSLDEWKEIIAELGIKGQEELAKGTKSPIPFPYINNKMKNVIETLCPMSTSLNEYSKTPIPLEVLKQAKFCINENHFNRLLVYYDDKSPDPFLIGVTGHYDGYFYEGNNSIRIEGKFDSEKELRDAYKKKAENYLGAGELHVNHHKKDAYLVARWGDQLRDWKELTELASNRLIEELSAELNAKIAKLNEKLKTIKTNVPMYINGNMTRYDISSEW